MCLTVKFRNTKGQRQTDKQTEEPSSATLIGRPFYTLMQNGPQRYFLSALYKYVAVLSHGSQGS